MPLTQGAPIDPAKPYQECMEDKQKKTLKCCRLNAAGDGTSALQEAKLSNSGSVEQWEDQGSKDAVRGAYDHWNSLLSMLETPPIHPGIFDASNGFVARREGDTSRCLVLTRNHQKETNTLNITALKATPVNIPLEKPMWWTGDHCPGTSKTIVEVETDRCVI